MSDTKPNFSVSSANSVVTPDSGTITKLEQEEKVTIKRTANHNELSMMESSLLQIKRKINLISVEKNINVNTILIGAAIPYAIDIINDFLAKKTPNCLPFFICILLIAASKFLAFLAKVIPSCKFLVKIVPYLNEDISATNKVHLNDLQYLVEQVEKAQLSEDN